MSYYEYSAVPDCNRHHNTYYQGLCSAENVFYQLHSEKKERTNVSLVTKQTFEN